VDARHRPVALVENLGTLFQSGLTLVAMLARFGWWLPVALFASTAPALGVVVRYALRQHRWRMSRDIQFPAGSSGGVRCPGAGMGWCTSFQDWGGCPPRGEAAPEVGLLGTGGHFRELYRTIRDRLRGERLELARSEAAAEITAAVIGLAVMGAAVAWMVLRAARGSVSLGDLAMFYQAFSQGQRLMRTLLETVGQIYSNSLFLENLFEFLELEPGLVDPPVPAAAPVERGPALAFRGVSFRYPGQDQRVLEGFDLGRISHTLPWRGSGGARRHGVSTQPAIGTSRTARRAVGPTGPRPRRGRRGLRRASSTTRRHLGRNVVLTSTSAASRRKCVRNAGYADEGLSGFSPEARAPQTNTSV